MLKVTIEAVIELIEPFLAHEGYELVDAEFKNEQRGWMLRVYVDKVGGVNLDDCATISREMGNMLDVEDIIPQKYYLEVSSPGLNRPLRLKEHFEKVLGSRIKVKTKLPIEGQRNFKVTLKAVSGDSITVDDERKDTIIDINNIEKANLIYNF